MTKKIIAVDVDDVLADSAAAWAAFSNKTWGTNLTADDFDEDYGKAWGTALPETERRAALFHDPDVFFDFLPNPEAYAVLERLKSYFTLVVATSRRSIMKEVTHRWLDHHYGGIFSGVYFSGIYDGEPVAGRHLHTKAELLQTMGADYLLDDQLKHCIGFAESGGQALLIGDKRWNQHHDLPLGVTRCVDWAAVEAYFTGRRQQGNFTNYPENL